MLLVERMLTPPAICISCGCGNTPDGDTGEIGPFIDFVRDVDWGDAVYLCIPCGMRVGALAGMISKQDAQDLQSQIKKLEQDKHNLEGEMELRRRRENEFKRRADAVEVLQRAS